MFQPFHSCDFPVVTVVAGRNSAAGQSSPGPPLMIDETGQKEREMLDPSSLQGQSDDSLQDESLFQQLSSLEEQNQKLQQKIVETEKEKERLKAILDSQDGARFVMSLAHATITDTLHM